MHLPLIALLVLTAPSLAPQSRFSRLMVNRADSLSVEAAAAKPLGVVEARTSPRAPGTDQLHAPDDFLRAWSSLGNLLGVVHAVRWVDSLPLKVAVQDGGVTFSLRFRV